VLGWRRMTAPSGVTVPPGGTTVSFQTPPPLAPVGFVELTVIWTLPRLPLPVLNTTLTTLLSPAAIKPIAGQVVIALTAPVGAQVAAYRVSTLPVLVIVKLT